MPLTGIVLNPICQTSYRAGWIVVFFLLLLAQGCSLVSGTANLGVPSTTQPSEIKAPVAKSSTTGPPPQQNLKIPPSPAVGVHMGEASWYGPGFNGKKTASGEIFDDSKLTAAHKTLPLGSKVRVTSLSTGDSVEVEINDRGPFVAGRIIDLSHAAARALGIVDNGTARVRIETIADSPKAADATERGRNLEGASRRVQTLPE